MSELIVIVSAAAAAAAAVLVFGWRRALVQSSAAAPQLPVPAGPLPAPGRAGARDGHGELYHWPELGRFEFPVAATGQYQSALRGLREHHGELCRARLHTTGTVGDPVEVRVEGLRVGYLRDGDATRFQRRLAYECRPGAPSQCAARIVPDPSSGRRGERLLYTIVLDLKPFRH